MASIYGAPKLPIITSGLQLYLNPSLFGSYPGTGANWYDISGNKRNMSLIASVSYVNSNNRKYLAFNGTNQYAQNTSVSGIGSSNYTLIAAINSNATQGAETKFIGFGGTPSTTGFGVSTGGTANNNQLMWEWNGSDYLQQTTLTLTNGVWYFAALVITPTLVTVMLNTQTYTKSVSYSAITPNAIYVGAQSSVQRYFNGNIGAVLMYTRALSADELTFNYQALSNYYYF